MPDFHSPSRECIKILSADGIVMHINPSGLALLETDSSDALIGKRYAELWPRDSRLNISEAIRSAGAGRSVRIEGCCHTLAGTPRWWESVFYSDKIGASKDAVVIGISRDISALRQDALAMQMSRERFALLAETFTEGILGVGADGLCYFANAAAGELVGSSSDSLIGRTFQSLVRRRTDALVMDAAHIAATRAAEPISLDLGYWHCAGQVLPVALGIYPMPAKARWCSSVVVMSTGAPRAALPQDVEALLAALIR